MPSRVLNKSRSSWKNGTSTLPFRISNEARGNGNAIDIPSICTEKCTKREKKREEIKVGASLTLPRRSLGDVFPKASSFFSVRDVELAREFPRKSSLGSACAAPFLLRFSSAKSACPRRQRCMPRITRSNIL